MGRRHSRGPRVCLWTAPTVPADTPLSPILSSECLALEQNPTAAQEIPEPPDLAGHRGHRKNRLWGGGENQTWGRGRSCGSGVVPAGGWGWPRPGGRQQGKHGEPLGGVVPARVC